MAKVIFSLVALLCGLNLVLGQTYYSCNYDKSTNKFSLTVGKDQKAMAFGYYQDNIEKNGWGLLEIVTNAQFTDEEQLLCAGYIEGSLTSTRIYQLWRSFWESTFNATNFQTIVDFTTKTMAWTQQQIESLASHDSYWNEVDMVMTQFEGILQGYNDHPYQNKALQAGDLFLLNMVGDLDDLIPALTRQQQKARGEKTKDWATSEEDARNAIYNSHCSVIIKPLPDGSDLVATHTMWASFYQMLMIQKYYNFNLHAHTSFAKRVSFSSYPGFLSSEDDFYLLSSGLLVMETTNEVFNLSLYDSVTPNSLMSWIRAVVANRMARDGEQWVSVFKRYNSGTYNNQWMIVDFRRFTPGAPINQLKPGTLWIGSQLPGYFFQKDVTEVINQQGYWPSYNVPYFKEAFDLLGYPEMVKLYGDLWTYENCPRAKIFRQRHNSVKDIKSLQSLIRYNNWQNDPLSLNCSVNQIAARADLSQPDRTDYCAPAAFGAINAKISSFLMNKNFNCSIQAGPTHDQETPFAWTPAVEKQFPGTKHYGQPKLFNFPWISFVPQN